MKRIIIHWTAGAWQPNTTDYTHYHFLVNSQGLIIRGQYDPEDNENCTDGKYAQHCGGGNTGAIGVSLCGMAGYVSGKPNSTKYPLNQLQCEKCWSLVAKLCKEYKIPITADTVMTHYEFGQKHPKTSSYGKIDITYLTYKPELKATQIGDYIRNKVKWYYNKE